MKPSSSSEYYSVYIALSDNLERIKVTKLWTEEFPTDPIGWYMFGELAIENKLYDDARCAFETSLSFDAKNLSTLGRLGDIYGLQGDYFKAYTSYDAILKNKEVPSWCLIGVANICEKVYRNDLAFQLFSYIFLNKLIGDQSVVIRIFNIYNRLDELTRVKYKLIINQIINNNDLDRDLISDFYNKYALYDLSDKKEIKNNYNESNVLNLQNELILDDSNLHDILNKEWFKTLENLFFNELDFSIVSVKNGKIIVSVKGFYGDTFDLMLWIDDEIQGEIKFERKNLDNESLVCLGEFELPIKYRDNNSHVMFLGIIFEKIRFHSKPIVLSYTEHNITINGVTNLKIFGDFNTTNNGSIPSIYALLNDNINCEIEYILHDNIDRAGEIETSLTTEFSIALPFFDEKGMQCNLYDDKTKEKILEINIASAFALLCNEGIAVARSDGLKNKLLYSLYYDSAINKNKSDIIFNTNYISHQSKINALPSVSIIIPIYEGLEATKECIESVLISKNDIATEIIIINDHTPNLEIKDYLYKLDARNIKNVKIIHTHKNIGFSAAVNIGIIIAKDQDVILLNSDAVVPSGWVDRLSVISKKDDRIGTVTPFSNNAEICSLPYICKAQSINDISLAIKIDEKAQSCNEGQFIDIPVAVGFCMYVKRKCIIEIGYFDSETWGRGYGEEIDFCLKASIKGWRHVLASDVYVVHRGNISFGDLKLERVANSSKKISEMYPFYDEMIQNFIRNDPISTCRKKINFETISDSLKSKNILHVCHGYGGGTQQYVSDQFTLNRQTGYSPLLLEFKDDGHASLKIDLCNTDLIGLFGEKYIEHYNVNQMAELKADLILFDIEYIHLHSPFGISSKFLEWMIGKFNTRLTIHDYAWICPQLTLTTIDKNYCQEPSFSGCNLCISKQGSHKGLSGFIKEFEGDITKYRSFFNKILSNAEIVFTGSQDVINRFKRNGMHDINFIKQEYKYPDGSIFLKKNNIGKITQLNQTVRVGVIGKINFLKGYYNLLAYIEEIENSNLPIEFIIFGYTEDDARLLKYKNIKILGEYKDDDLHQLLTDNNINLILFPGKLPETYSYTLTHALNSGLRILAFDIGAIAERLKPYPEHIVLDLDEDAKNVCNMLLNQK